MYPSFKLTSTTFLLFVVCCCSCKSNNKNEVTDASEMDGTVKTNIENIIAAAEKNEYKLKDSSLIKYYTVLKNYYKNNEYKPIWSSNEKWLEPANLLVQYIDNAALQGLYKDDYYFTRLQKIHSILSTDSIKRMNAVLWANADV